MSLKLRQVEPEPAKVRPMSKRPSRPVEPGGLDEEITLRDLMLIIARGKWIVLATLTSVVVLVTLWMKTSDPLYTASMVVAPAAEAGAGSLASKLARYAELASFAGVELPSDETVSAFTHFIELQTSVTLARRLHDKHGVVYKVYERYWDSRNKRWTQPQDMVEAVKGQLRSFLNLPVWTPPSPTALAEYLKDELELSAVGTTGMRTIKFRHKDPEFAEQLLRWVHSESDDLIREEALDRTSRQIAYIEGKLETVTVAEHRQSLVQLLSDQEKQMMMIQLDLPYAARIIEPPTVSDAPTSPKPFLVLAVAVVGGGGLGVFLVFLVDALRRGEQRHSSPSAS